MAPVMKWQIMKDDVPKYTVESGKGIPRTILNRLRQAEANASAGHAEPGKLTNQLSKGLFGGFRSPASTSTTKPESAFSLKLNLNQYEEPEEDEQLDPSNSKAQLDVTALDRYNEDIRKYRRMLLDECRLIPLKGEVDKILLEKVRIAAMDLSRSCYYGTYKAHALGESSVMIYIWLLSRRNLPILFQMRILQSLSELIWNSHQLKKALVPSCGVRIIVRLMKGGMNHHSLLATWACYTLLSGAIGCGEVVAEVVQIPQMDEYIGEISFPQYWKDWPANFGVILQGILFGPSSVSPMFEEGFEFM